MVLAQNVVNRKLESCARERDGVVSGKGGTPVDLDDDIGSTINHYGSYERPILVFRLFLFLVFYLW